MASRRINLLVRTRTRASRTRSASPASSGTLKARVSTSIATRSNRLLLVLCVSAFFFAHSFAQSTVSSSDVEAAYLYNFGKFIEWPSAPDAGPAPFSICVVGKDDFVVTLDSLIQNDTVNGRTIVARQLPSVAVTDSCQILFLGASEQSRLAKDLDAVKDRPILTVSNIPGFLNHGGMIEFQVRRNRVRFAVNLDSASRAHLSLSSELLKVAVCVHAKPSQEGQ